ncbi:hypothetical protein GCM10023170_066620 [Phytohabitans houttuyneae]|uniref:Uncharacterized protein n=1 Tax=Phytohabitans houttuyneae TaxID=1076126 RepID=A0A6V8K881_9ACTN|nr:hypothetical protein Phou_055920 [Phytohabitans houttuyneae]
MKVNQPDGPPAGHGGTKMVALRRTLIGMRPSGATGGLVDRAPGAGASGAGWFRSGVVTDWPELGSAAGRLAVEVAAGWPVREVVAGRSAPLERVTA